ncbi:MAG: zinc ribbon domain-containing protein [Betaproteobacteria bacterium]|nr:zinc ribbon domain-containing protein [Betaproteobacteria bacterium]
MPIYEYQCRDCNKEFEKLMRSSTPAPACPQCGSTALQKKLSTFAAVTAASSTTFNETPTPCQGCGMPGGPGACGFSQG